MIELKSKKEILDYLEENGCTESNLCEVCETDWSYFFLYADVDSSFLFQNILGVCIIKSKDGYFSINVDYIEDSVEHLDINSVQDLSDEDIAYYKDKVHAYVYSFEHMLNMK